MWTVSESTTKVNKKVRETQNGKMVLKKVPKVSAVVADFRQIARYGDEEFYFRKKNPRKRNSRSCIPNTNFDRSNPNLNMLAGVAKKFIHCSDKTGKSR